MRQSIDDITNNLVGLQAALVRVVRNSTEDANRRQFERFPLKAKAEIFNALNARIGGELVNISEGGAMIGGSSEMRMGENGGLLFEGMSVPLPFVVRGQREDAFHVEFQLTEALRATFLRWFSQRISAKLAKAS